MDSSTMVWNIYDSHQGPYSWTHATHFRIRKSFISYTIVKLRILEPKNGQSYTNLSYEKQRMVFTERKWISYTKVGTIITELVPKLSEAHCWQLSDGVILRLTHMFMFTYIFCCDCVNKKKSAFR